MNDEDKKLNVALLEKVLLSLFSLLKNIPYIHQRLINSIANLKEKYTKVTSEPSLKLKLTHLEGFCIHVRKIQVSLNV